MGGRAPLEVDGGGLNHSCFFLQKYISRRESEVVFPEEVWRLVSYMEQG